MTKMHSVTTVLLLVFLVAGQTTGFQGSIAAVRDRTHRSSGVFSFTTCRLRHTLLWMNGEGNGNPSSPEAEAESKGEVEDDDVLEPEMLKFESEEEKKEAVGNLVADDEWMGLSMELGELVRTAVIEDLKSNAKDFLGKDDYKVSN